MVCETCGTENANDYLYCMSCGAPLNPNTSYNEGHHPTDSETVAVAETETPSAKAPNHVLGLISMILGIATWVFHYVLGIITCGLTAYLSPFTAIAGIITSIIALKKSKSTNRKKWFAVMGLITSSVYLVFSFISLVIAGCIMLFYGLLNVSA